VDEADLDFVSDASAAVLLQSPRGGRLILWLLVLFVSAALFWADRAEIDEVTKGMGKVIPSHHVQVVQNLEGGILSELLVKEGDMVEPGQILLQIDATRFTSSLWESQLEALALKAKAARLQAEVTGKPFVVPESMRKEHSALVEQEERLYRARQAELETSRSILQEKVKQAKQELQELKAKKSYLAKSLELVRKELKMTKPLVAAGAVSEVEVLRLKRQVNELEGELSATQLAIPRARSKLAEAEDKIAEVVLKFRNQAHIELTDVNAKLSKLSETRVALEDRVERTAVRSPVKGTIKQIMVNTIGGVIQPGMELVEVVPLEDFLLVEVRIKPRDIAFLRPGQHAVVKLTAYDFSIYGGLEGEVVHISADALTDEKTDESYYLVRVRTKKTYLGDEENPLPVIPGMQAEVDIVTGKKTVLAYLLKPVLKAKANALRER